MSYSIDSRTNGVLILTNLRMVMQTSKSKMAIPLQTITLVGLDNTKWGKGEEDTHIVLEATIKTNRYKIVVFVEKDKRDDVISEMRRAIIGTSIIYFKSPATVGGVLNTTQGWKKGVIKMGATSIKLLAKDGTVEIGYRDIVDHGRNLRTLDTKGKPSITILHVENDEEVSSVMIGNNHSLSMIEDYLETLTENMNADLDLDEMTNNLLMVLYTGDVNDDDLIEMMGITVEELDKIYDRLISLNLAKVVRVKKIMALTNPGIR
ncbi:MAG: CheF family chemotaxis protein, partial [Candidatus Thermoplasmatota archaeon]|nr:CheF family chemotaxis protein [Candidatus Thermoplasmatota archaeon]